MTDNNLMKFKKINSIQWYTVKAAFGVLSKKDKNLIKIDLLFKRHHDIYTFSFFNNFIYISYQKTNMITYFIIY